MGETGAPYPQHQDGHVDCLTTAQSGALIELCSRLPSAVESLNAEQLTIWGVQLSDLVTRQQQGRGGAKGADDSCPLPSSGPSSGPTRTQSVVLLKFLRARQFNVQAALAMLVNCLKWRRDFDVAGLSLETFPPQLAAAGQLSGRDRAGNPVTYNYYGTELDLESVFGSPGGVATFVRWRVKLMEQAVGLLDFEGGIEHVTQVHDYSGASLFRMNSHVKAASREIIRLFQDNYPEMLSAKLFLNVPRVMEFVFGLLSAFSDAKTRAKFVMASPARARAVLLQYIDPVQLPSRFGGFLETCSIPPNRGRPTAFALASKHVSLKPGDSHVTSKLVGSEGEVVWCFCTAGPELTVSLGFRPRDNGEAAAAAARQPDHVPGGAHPNSRHRDAQHITESHNMTIVKDAASGRLVLGCPGEVIMTLDNTRHSGLFSSGPSLTVYYALMSSEPGLGNSQLQHGSLGSVSVGNASIDNPSGRLFGDNAPSHPLDWRYRVLSYKSFGCSSFASNDVPTDVTNVGEPAAPESPSGRGQQQAQQQQAQQQQAQQQQQQQQGQQQQAQGYLGNGVAAAASNALGGSRFETVEEVDESGTVSPAGRSTTYDLTPRLPPDTNTNSSMIADTDDT